MRHAGKTGTSLMMDGEKQGISSRHSRRMANEEYSGAVARRLREVRLSATLVRALASMVAVTDCVTLSLMPTSSFSRRFSGWLVGSACALTVALPIQAAHAQISPPPRPPASAVAAAATNTGIADDKTAEVLKKFEEGGLREIIVVKRRDITIHLMITAAGDTQIKKQAFAVPDDSFRMDYFTDFVIGQFSDAIKYFSNIVPELGVKEIYLVLDDLKETGLTTVSQAHPGSRVIDLGISRWHQIYKGDSTYLGEVSTIHEFTHVEDYGITPVTDPAKDKYNREMKGVVFELLAFTFHEGLEGLRTTYPKIAGRVADNQQILSDDYKSMTVVRNVAFWMFWNVMSGNYIVNDKSDPLEALKKFGHLYLTSKQRGSAGFDAACEGAGLANDVGQTLTLKFLQTALYENLTGTDG